ncbi:hypothetical protein LP316_05340 [Thalassotalea sp. LPB0316]|uniref:hypothetical protein n=1 Tax=Thalassotalea sp. LPB0316 TaxID=2769490 RepID=UPI001867A3CF|nr:hypothetical protein [Thalassotalea sp. LPB0316]QOL26725.1 hypothetical protein LP316_05340 [Thalassotalea sp. LPB0316]
MLIYLSFILLIAPIILIETYILLTQRIFFSYLRAVFWYYGFAYLFLMLQTGIYGVLFMMIVVLLNRKNLHETYKDLDCYSVDGLKKSDLLTLFNEYAKNSGYRIEEPKKNDSDELCDEDDVYRFTIKQDKKLELAFDSINDATQKNEPYSAKVRFLGVKNSTFDKKILREITTLQQTLNLKPNNKLILKYLSRHLLFTSLILLAIKFFQSMGFLL